MKIRLYKNLMQNALDGTLSDHDRKTWDALLLNYPEMQNEYKVQEEMTYLLQDVALENPPDSLTHDIMRAVQISKRERAAWWKRIRMIQVPTVRIRYAYSFAAGLALGLLLLTVLNKNGAMLTHPESSQLSGTMRPFSSDGKTEIINLQEMQGEIAWNRKPNAVDIQLSLNPQVISTLQFEYAKEAFFLKSFKSDQATLVNTLNMTPEMMTLQINAPCNIRLEFSRSEAEVSPIIFKIKQIDEMSFTCKID
jgi:hypothetical protein